MYCVKCGAKLADSEKKCPLCETAVYHPKIKRNMTEGPYPKDKYPVKKHGARWFHIFFTIAYLLPIFTVLLCDLQVNSKVTWSGIVIGALLLAYIIFILPSWFRNANPVIFVPCAFVAVGLFLLYISITTNGGWFLKFAFPVTGALCLIVTTAVTLLRYLKKGKLYVFGSGFLALGGLMLLTEFLSTVTFKVAFTGWSFYPLMTFATVGSVLMFLAICRRARESVERRFFI